MPEPSANSEFAFLLACCAQIPDPERQRSLQQAFASPFDWEPIVARAEYHGVIPQVYRACVSVAITPPAALMAAYSINCKRTLWFAAELARVTKHLEEHGTETLAYKGPALAQVLYGSVCERQFHDLDLVVRPGDVRGATTALSDLGYYPAAELTARQERERFRCGYELAFDHAYGENLIELHWRLLPRFYAMDFSIEDLFHRAETIQIAGQNMRTIAPDDLMLALCAHAAKHMWLRLSLLCDIVQLSKLEALNWRLVHREAARLGLQRIVAVCFVLANRLLGAALPETIAADAKAKAIAEEVAALLASNFDFNFESPAYFREMLRLRERAPDRLRLLWRLLTTPSEGEWNAVRLPDALFPLYHVVRAGRLMNRFLPGNH
jgi:hypothetical protein